MWRLHPRVTACSSPGSCDSTRSVHANGAAVVYVMPDRALLQLGVQSNAVTPDLARSENQSQVQRLTAAVRALGVDAKDVRVVMVTTDPKRDTPEALRTFMDKFNPHFIGLTGTDEQLAQVWKDYGVAVENGGEAHSNFVYVIDPAGNFRETFLPDSQSDDIAADLRLLLGEK